MHYYHAFGLVVASDFNIPEFLPAPNISSTDVYIKVGSVPDNSSEGPMCLLLNIEGVARILVENGRVITYMPYPSCEEDSLRLFLLGSAMGALLQQRGLVVLHGNAISWDAKTCTVFVGVQGAGKSTTAAWHYQQGAFILADDVCAVAFDTLGSPCVIPSYPQLKLWQTSADLLRISTQHLRRLRPSEAKFALPIADRFFSTSLPIERIVELDADRQEPHMLRGIEKLAVLKTQSYRYSFVYRMNRQLDYLRNLMRLADSVEVVKEARLQLL